MSINNNVTKGIIHFIGIGGIGMSGIAELMLNQGYTVQGSDISLNTNVKRLKQRKIIIFLNHKKSNIKNVSAVVYSSAIKKNNPEIIESKKLGIPIVSRADMLAELMRYKHAIAVAGSHGKTTTTSLIGSILDIGGKDPTIINGGIINSLANNNRLGLGKWIVVEADESDGAFLRLPHEINIITNIDSEHLDYYKNIRSLISSFKKFATSVPFYGYSIICLDNINSRKLAYKINTRKVITYGYNNKESDINITKFLLKKDHTLFSINIKKNIFHNYNNSYQFKLNLLGKHNILNASASIIVALLLDIPIYKIKTALEDFQGVKRRFTFLGNIKKCKIYDDYAHHPNEILASYEIAKHIADKKIIVIFQPHRFSRTHELYKDFVAILKKIDILFVCDIYSAGEKLIKNVNSAKLAKDIKKNNSQEVYYLKELKKLDQVLSKFYDEKNLIIFMGAGSISQWAHKLMEKHGIQPT